MKLFHSDVLRVDPALAKYDLCVSSPPYNLEKVYSEYVNDGMPYFDYKRWIERVGKWLYEAGNPNARVCLNIPLDTNLNGIQSFYADVVLWMQLSGWRYRTTIVWNEGNISRRTAWGSFARPTAPNVITPVEMIVVFYKGKWDRSPFEYGIPHTWDITNEQFIEWTLGLWSFSNDSKGFAGHPAAFPVELPKRLILLYSFKEDTILDFACGSGTTLVAARALGRECVGIEIERRWIDATIIRCGVDDSVLVNPSASPTP
jgi:site-specific DNA-methyltransferase (adenine-specific)